jgi:hypothetical protein
VILTSKMPSSPFKFSTFSENVLRNAAGRTKSQNGLNKEQTTMALLAVDEALGQPDISDVVKRLKSDGLRKMLKKLLDKLPCDSNGPMPTAGVLQGDCFLRYVMFGMPHKCDATCASACDFGHVCKRKDGAFVKFKKYPKPNKSSICYIFRF